MHMLKIDLAADNGSSLDRVVTSLRRGGSSVVPSDSMYALVCNALDPVAVARVFDAKHRSYVRALPMLVRDISWARELVYMTAVHEKIISRFWPGRVTFILPRRPLVPSITCGGGQAIGVRAPDYPLLQSLLYKVGYPLAATSANRNGTEPTYDAERIAFNFAQSAPQPDYILDAGLLPETQLSTVVDLSGRYPRILREGAVPADKIMALL